VCVCVYMTHGKPFHPSTQIHFERTGEIGVKNAVGFLPLLPKKFRAFGCDSAVAAQWVPRKNNKQRLKQLAQPRVWEEPRGPFFVNYDPNDSKRSPSSTKRSVDLQRISEMAVPRAPRPWVPNIRNLPSREPLWPKIKMKMQKEGCPMPETRERSFDIGIPTGIRKLRVHAIPAGSLRKERKLKLELSAGTPVQFSPHAPLKGLIAPCHGFDPDPCSGDCDLNKHINDDNNTPSDTMKSSHKTQSLEFPRGRLSRLSKDTYDSDVYEDYDEDFDELDGSSEETCSRSKTLNRNLDAAGGRKCSLPERSHDDEQHVSAQLCTEIVKLATSKLFNNDESSPKLLLDKISPDHEARSMIDNETSIAAPTTPAKESGGAAHSSRDLISIKEPADTPADHHLGVTHNQDGVAVPPTADDNNGENKNKETKNVLVLTNNGGTGTPKREEDPKTAWGGAEDNSTLEGDDSRECTLLPDNNGSIRCTPEDGGIVHNIAEDIAHTLPCTLPEDGGKTITNINEHPPSPSCGSGHHNIAPIMLPEEEEEEEDEYADDLHEESVDDYSPSVKGRKREGECNMAMDLGENEDEENLGENEDVVEQPEGKNQVCSDGGHGGLIFNNGGGGGPQSSGHVASCSSSPSHASASPPPLDFWEEGDEYKQGDDTNTYNDNSNGVVEGSGIPATPPELCADLAGAGNADDPAASPNLDAVELGAMSRADSAESGHMTECVCSVGSGSSDNQTEAEGDIAGVNELYVIVGDELGADDVETTAENSSAPEGMLTTDDDGSPWLSPASRPCSRLLGNRESGAK